MKHVELLNLQRFCTKDGPGIRTTVFFKGCPLHCLWCHNPESQAARHELLYQPAKCLHCLSCVAVCPHGCHRAEEGHHVLDRASCTACGACADLGCPALEMAGKTVFVEAVLAEVKRDLPYYRNSGGGLTLSGGEPLMQAEAALALLRGAREAGIHTAVETCGAVPRAVLEQTLPLVDLYLYDYKETDPARHRAYTGMDNRLILENLYYLDAMQKPTVLRCPIIPGLNDRPDHLSGIAAVAGGMRFLREIVIEPYHTLGVGKYERLGRTYTLADAQPHESAAIDALVATLQEMTSVAVKRA